jgi:hypothetical protein
MLFCRIRFGQRMRHVFDGYPTTVVYISEIFDLEPFENQLTHFLPHAWMARLSCGECNSEFERSGMNTGVRAVTFGASFQPTLRGQPRRPRFAVQSRPRRICPSGWCQLFAKKTLAPPAAAFLR